MPGRRKRPTSDRRLAELEEFVQLHKRMPRQHNREAAERSLYRWVIGVAAGRYAGVSHETAARVVALMKADGRLDSGVDDARLEQLEEFVARTGRFPSRHGPAARVTGELMLAAWASQVRSGRRQVSSRVAAAVARIASESNARHPGAAPRRES
jgi:hypothetical protein